MLAFGLRLLFFAGDVDAEDERLDELDVLVDEDEDERLDADEELDEPEELEPLELEREARFRLLFEGDSRELGIDAVSTVILF